MNLTSLTGFLTIYQVVVVKARSSKSHSDLTETKSWNTFSKQRPLKARQLTNITKAISDDTFLEFSSQLRR